MGHLERRKALFELSYNSMRPLIQDLGTNVQPGLTMLDVGSGEGYMAVRMAEEFKASKVILTDRNYRPVEIPQNGEFHLIDVFSPEFLRRFQNEVHVVTCVNAMHEFEDPLQGVGQLIRVLPRGGRTLIFEFSEEGWFHQGEIVSRLDKHNRDHFREDIEHVRRSGLNTNSGIREFWEKRVFPGVPGNCRLMFCGDLFVVLYAAYDWYEVKEPPEWMKAEVDAHMKARHQ